MQKHCYFKNESDRHNGYLQVLQAFDEYNIPIQVIWVDKEIIKITKRNSDKIIALEIVKSKEERDLEKVINWFLND